MTLLSRCPSKKTLVYVGSRGGRQLVAVLVCLIPRQPLQSGVDASRGKRPLQAGKCATSAAKHADATPPACHVAGTCRKQGARLLTWSRGALCPDCRLHRGAALTRARGMQARRAT